jgi:dUTP pyrophosphatase
LKLSGSQEQSNVLKRNDFQLCSPAVKFSMTLRFERTCKEARVPTKATPGSAGFDLYSAEDVVISPGNRAKVNVGIRIAVPEGCYGRIAPRSGLAYKHFIDVGAGVIDSDYRGDVSVLLFNFSETSFEVKKGDRIGQLIIEKILNCNLLECTLLPGSTQRADQGFGSSGL